MWASDVTASPRTAKSSEDEAIAEAAQSLSGQFALAEVEGEQRIYHVTTEVDEQGEEQEYVEHIMNEGDDVVKFVAWFFDGFSISSKRRLPSGR